MRIREAKPTDAPRLAEIHLRGWQFTYKNILPNAYLSKLTIEDYTAKWHGWLRTTDPNTFHLVAEMHGYNVVGFVSGCPERTAVSRHWAELSAIYVLTEYKHKGIGTALFKMAVERFKKQGYKGMISWMLAENPAGAFYTKLGGTQKGARTKLIGGVTKELIAHEWTF